MDGIYIPMKLPGIEDNHRIKAEIRKIDGELQFGIMTDGYYCCENWTYYPITTIQDHGDLIDRDELKKYKKHSYKEFHENIVSVAQIDWMPAVIPSSDNTVNLESKGEEV